LLLALGYGIGVSFGVVVLVKVVKSRLFGERHLEYCVLDEIGILGQCVGCACGARLMVLEMLAEPGGKRLSRNRTR
jgi:hypothetical protein